MLTDEILKALVEGIIYIAPEPVTLDGILKVLEGEERERVKAKLEELVADFEQNSHGIQIRQVANGYKFSTKAEHHEILRRYVKSLKPPVRLSKPALETLAVIAYRQPVTIPEIEEIRGVDSGGVIHTLLEKKLVVTSGRKSVVGRPILYRTSKDFLVHFGLKDVGELPSLKEFEELAKRALGSEWPTGEAPAAASDATTAPSPEADAAAGEAGLDTLQEASLSVAEETAPLENPAATEAAPATEEETGAVSAGTSPVPQPEPVFRVVAETTTLDDPATAAPPSDSSGSELPAESADVSTLATPETPSASDSTATLEDLEPKP